MFVAPSRAFVFDVTALAPSSIATTPSTPTRSTTIATITSTRVKPRWPERCLPALIFGLLDVSEQPLDRTSGQDQAKRDRIRYRRAR